MKSHWTKPAATSATAGAVCALAGIALRRALRRAGERQRATDRKILELTAAVCSLESRLAELSRGERDRAPESIAAAAEGVEMARLQQPKPELLAVMTAAATAFLGKTARIRSARLVPAATDDVSPWSQQGRVIVQTSHNLRARE